LFPAIVVLLAESHPLIVVQNNPTRLQCFGSASELQKALSRLCERLCCFDNFSAA
jgi:hypothetical protein